MWMSCADLNCRSRSNLAYRRSAFLSGGNDLDVVWLEPGIGRRDRNPFRLRLRNEETVKRVAMMKREPCDANGMAKLNRNGCVSVIVSPSGMYSPGGSVVGVCPGCT